MALPPMRRTRDLAEVIAFWDGSSNGTMDTVCRALAAQKPVEEVSGQ